MEKLALGIDLGGTHVRGGLVNRDGLLKDASLSTHHSVRINRYGTSEEVLKDVYTVCDALLDANVSAIGVGVPSMVDLTRGLVYDVQNIPSWKEVPLKDLLESKYQRPVIVNNDANCFAMGEFYFGKGKEYQTLAGITIGTGMGCGMILNEALYSGPNCGAGEFGLVDYLDHNFDYYASGSFFENVYSIDGETVFKNVVAGDPLALKMYEEFGLHLGKAIKIILYALDVECIVLGGSVKNAWQFFEKSMWQTVRTLAYPKVLETLKIYPSELDNGGLLGAGALCF